MSVEASEHPSVTQVALRVGAPQPPTLRGEQARPLVTQVALRRWGNHKGDGVGEDGSAGRRTGLDAHASIVSSEVHTPQALQ